MTKRTTAKKTRRTSEAHTAQLETYLTRRGPGEEDHAPTLERVAHAARGGQRITARLILTESGFPTANYYWNITPVIDDLKRRGTLSHEEYEAAFRFMRHWHHGIHRGPPTSKYTPRYDGEVADMTPGERQWHYAGMAKKAFRSVSPMLQPALAWLIRAMGDPLPLKALGAYYSPDKGAQTQSSQGALALKLTCVELCTFYGVPHDLSARRIEKLSEVLLAQLTIATVS